MLLSRFKGKDLWELPRLSLAGSIIQKIMLLKFSVISILIKHLENKNIMEEQVFHISHQSNNSKLENQV